MFMSKFCIFLIFRAKDRFVNCFFHLKNLRFEAGRWLDRYGGDNKVRLDLTPNVAVMGNDRGRNFLHFA
jgi:hypothetical protein